MGSLMMALDAAGVHAFTQYLKDMFYGGKEKGREMGVEASRLWVLNKLNEIARSRRVRKDEQWFLALLRFFFYHAFYVSSAKQDASQGCTDPALAALLREEGVLWTPSSKPASL